MNPMNAGNRNLMIGGTIAVILLIGVGGFFIVKGKSNISNTNTAVDEALPNTQALPTIDINVIVSLTADKLKREVTLSIEGIPQGTNSIDYEMSYLAQGDLPKGVIGTIEVDGKSHIEKTGITLGTCSSGACTYDKGVKSIKVALKFNSASGSKIFEEEFEI